MPVINDKAGREDHQHRHKKPGKQPAERPNALPAKNASFHLVVVGLLGDRRASSRGPARSPRTEPGPRVVEVGRPTSFRTRRRPRGGGCRTKDGRRRSPEDPCPQIRRARRFPVTCRDLYAAGGWGSRGGRTTCPLVPRFTASRDSTEDRMAPTRCQLRATPFRLRTWSRISWNREPRPAQSNVRPSPSQNPLAPAGRVAFMANSGYFMLVVSAARGPAVIGRAKSGSRLRRGQRSARQWPDLPPSFSSSRMPSMRMPRSTALHMS